LAVDVVNDEAAQRIHVTSRQWVEPLSRLMQQVFLLVRYAKPFKDHVWRVLTKEINNPFTILIRSPEHHRVIKGRKTGIVISACIFRSNPATQYDLTRPPNMSQAGHLL
jgi:tRNA A37 threonylcarbamoyladenosine synthetase subunit TsaC/SUA5/YrdC